MKHLLKSIALMIAATLFSISLKAQTVTLTSGNVNLRYSPSMRGAILSDYYGKHIHYAKGTSFNYAGETRNGFYSIYVNGEILWVTSDYSRLNGVRNNRNNYNSGRSLVINGTNVNFRLSPSLNAPTLKNSRGYNVHVPKYTRLPYLGASGSFFKTKYNGRIVYVYMQYAYVD